MGRFQDEQGNVIEVGSPDLNPDLIAGKTKVGDNTPLGRQPITSGVLEDGGDIPITDSEAVPPTSVAGLEVPEKTETPAGDRFGDLTGELDKINDELLGESGDRARAGEAEGVGGLEDTLNDLGGQLKFTIGQEKAIPLELQQEGEGRTRTKGGIAPIQAGRLRDNAIEAFKISSRIDGVNNLLGQAQRKVDAAMDEKYGELKRRKEQILENIDILIKSGTLDEEQQKRAEDARAKAQADLDKIAEDKETERAVLNKTNEFAAQVAELPNSAEIFFRMEHAENELEVVKIALEAGLSIPSSVDLTGTTANLRTFVKLRPDLELGTKEFETAFAAFEASRKSPTKVTPDPTIFTATGKELAKIVNDKFASNPEFTTKLSAELNDEMTRVFLSKYDAEVAYQLANQPHPQQPLDPFAYLEAFKKWFAKEEEESTENVDKETGKDSEGNRPLPKVSTD